MSAITRNQVFSATHTVGGLLPADMLTRISEGKDVKGSLPADYRVIGSRSVRDDAERRWDYLKAVWSELREQLPRAPEAETPADPTGVAITQWLEPLFAELGFGELTALGTSGIVSDDGSKTFAISHRWNHVPVHLAAWNNLLDKRPGGAGTVPAQSLVQECLNRADAHLWGVVSNGRELRLLRDSNALATASYVEFDLEAIFDGELFSEFVLLYRLLHVTRFKLDEGEAPSSSWLERWRVDAIDSGIRALHHQRNGVKYAITKLGTGFLKHPDNGELRKNLDVQAFHGALLRLVYRLIFLFVAEERDVLHPEDASAESRRRYANYFSSARLRYQANRRRGTSHGDLYQALRIVLGALGHENGRPELGLPGLGGLFDDTDADAPLRGLSLANADLLDAVRDLSRVRDGDSGRWRRVDYRHMGAEELGSIYESLLELVPKHSAVDRSFELIDRLGNDRKKTGSYYTPSSLIETLLDSTLDSIMDDAQKRGEQKASAAGVPDPAESIVGELLSLTVCDPACGSGHFLVAAARRIAKRVAAVRENNPEPTADAVSHALREVVARCVYGVDLNPMAVELAKVSLWLEAMERGKPLGFLDAHIKHGNGLIGATPALMRDGIPNKAFKPVEGDDEKYAKTLEKQNGEERKGQDSLFDLTVEPKVVNADFAAGLRRIIQASSDTLAEVHRQEADYRDWENSAEYQDARHVADSWCAAFMWHKTKGAPAAITHDMFLKLQDPTEAAASQETHDEIIRLRDEYRFFHWHLAFPDIFIVPDDGAGVDPATGWAGGFSCVLGNPPWDKLDFEDKKYFDVVEPSIAAISGTARRIRIAEWSKENPEAGERYRAARRRVKSTFLFAGSSGAFPFCGRGLTVKGVNSLQTDQLFAERFTVIVAPTGRVGCIIPTAIATGAGGQYLFGDLTRRGATSLLYDFENRRPLFIGVHSSYRFCLLTLVGRDLREPAAAFAFYLAGTADLEEANRVFALSPEEIALISPNTLTLPIFRSRRDADLTSAIHRRFSVLYTEGAVDGNPWRVSFKNLFNSTDDSDLFRVSDDLKGEGWTLEGNVFVQSKERMLPVFEGKMGHLFDHRWNRYYGVGDNDYEAVPLGVKVDPGGVATPRRWIKETGSISIVRKGKNLDIPGVSARLAAERWDRSWLCGWRDIARATDERTAIPAVVPVAAAVETFPLMLSLVEPTLIGCLVAAQSSLVFDFVARQKASGAHMGRRVWKQLPVPAPRVFVPHVQFLVSRLLELVFNTGEMAGFASDLGDSGQPFRWDEKRRARIRAELDAFFFHIYGVDRPDVDYVLETFQSDSGGGLKNNEIARYGTYRTKGLVLEEYDRMTVAGISLDVPLVDGENYTSTLLPPPGYGPRH